MIGIIPAAGMATRFNGTCKALIEIKGKRLIEHQLDLMDSMGIDDVIIIEHRGSISMNLGERYHRMNLYYVNQEERNGIGKAILLSYKLYYENFFPQDVFLILGDIYVNPKISKYAKIFEMRKLQCYFGVKPVQNKKIISQSYGITPKGKIIEKPENLEKVLPLLGMGVYFFNNSLFNYLMGFKGEKLGITEILDKIPKEEKDMFVFHDEYYNINSQIELDEVK